MTDNSSETSEITVNHVRALREAAGLTQSALASLVGVSRQSLSSIEGGRTMPGVHIALRIAAILNTTVEHVFQLPESTHEESVRAEAVRVQPDSFSAPQSRVTLAQIQGRWLAFPLEHQTTHRAADGIARAATRQKQIEIHPLRSLQEARENLVLTGCAGALGLLADQLNVPAGHRTDAQAVVGRVIWFHGSSTAALKAIANHQTHIAGVHLVDPRTGESNTADVRRHTGNLPLALITLANWQTGILVPAGNRRAIQSGDCLARPDLRIAIRERGAGTRRLLENLWKKAGKPARAPDDAPELLVRSHMEVAQAIAIGVADTGIASQDAALAYNLDFIPLADERYDLVIPLLSLEDARVQRLLNHLTSSAYRLELGALGYDTTSSGNRVEYSPAV